MNLTKAIIHTLGDTAAVTAVIPAARIFDVHGSQNMDLTGGPVAVVQEVSSVAQTELDGPSNLIEVGIQVTILSNSGPDAKAAELVIRQALDDVSGALGPGGEEVTVTGCRFESAIDAPQPPEVGSDVAGHDRMLMFTIWHRLSVP